MRTFAGAVDIPAMAMVLGALLIIATANRFSRRGSVLMANQLLMEMAFLYLLISAVGLFEDVTSFFSFHYIASGVLLTLAFAAILKIPVLMFCASNDTPPKVVSVTWKVLGALLYIVIMIYTATTTTGLDAFVNGHALVFVGISLILISAMSLLSKSSSVLQDIASQILNIGLVAMAIAIATAILDLYVIEAMAEVLRFGVAALLYTVFLHILLRLLGFALSDPSQDGFVRLQLLGMGGAVLAACYMVFAAQSLS